MMCVTQNGQNLSENLCEMCCTSSSIGIYFPGIFLHIIEILGVTDIYIYIYNYYPPQNSFEVS